MLRAAAGALLGALPLLYTMEMWWRARTIGNGLLLILFLSTVAVVVVCLLYSGFRRGPGGVLHLDIPIVFGVSVVVAAVTLLVVGRLAFGEQPRELTARMIALETLPCAVAAALAITQLRPRRFPDKVDRRIKRLDQDWQKVLATVAGAVFFAFNVAPTQEPLKMAIEARPYHFPLVLLFSLAVSYVIVFLADFAERAPGAREGALGDPLSETLVSYLVSLAISYGFLYAFGQISHETPVAFQLRVAVMMGYVTVLGGSAGRVLVAEG